MHPAIHEYLRENWGRFPAEELRAKLLTAGHPADAVDEEIRLVSSSGKLSTLAAEAPTPKLLTRSKVLDWLIGFLGPIIFGFLFLLTFIAYIVALIYTWHRYPFVRRGLVWAGGAYGLVALYFIVVLLVFTGGDVRAVLLTLFDRLGRAFEGLNPRPF